MVTGAAGRLGGEMVRELTRSHEVAGFDRPQLDITDETAVMRAATAERPDAIVNCAAYNEVDRAEDEPVAAFHVNAFGVQALARAAAGTGAIFVHFSTDFVFNGETDRPYTEDDRPDPRSVYAASKLVGEWLAREAPRHYVLRVESLFGGSAAGPELRPSSVGRIVEAIVEGREVPVFVDRTVSPSYAVDVAAATAQLLARTPQAGVYHCVNSGSCRWDELAVEASRLLGREPRLKPVTLESAPLKARRPRYCALSNARLAAAGIPMRNWRDALADYLTAMGRTMGRT
jgi:dTDP-4-dehydrorhamnose reductase